MVLPRSSRRDYGGREAGKKIYQKVPPKIVPVAAITGGVRREAKYEQLKISREVPVAAITGGVRRIGEATEVIAFRRSSRRDYGGREADQSFRPEPGQCRVPVAAITGGVRRRAKTMGLDFFDVVPVAAITGGVRRTASKAAEPMPMGSSRRDYGGREAVGKQIRSMMSDDVPVAAITGGVRRFDPPYSPRQIKGSSRRDYGGREAVGDLRTLYNFAIVPVAAITGGVRRIAGVVAILGLLLFQSPRLRGA